MGIPLKIDDNTLAGEFSHYTRVLIDIDLGSQLPELVLLNRASGGITISFFFFNEDILD